jgi:hypothetical protein
MFLLEFTPTNPRQFPGRFLGSIVKAETLPKQIAVVIANGTYSFLIVAWNLCQVFPCYVASV